MTTLFLLSSVAAFGDNFKGIISGRTGETLIVNGSQSKFTVVLADDTRVVDKRGLFGWGRTELTMSVLMPGLKISVDGTRDTEGRVLAKKITVDGDDLESAQMIEAGLQPTSDQVLEHEKELLEHQKAIGANKENIAANTADIETNQQQIAAHKQSIDQNMSDIQANSQRFTTLADYDVKANATVKFATGSSQISKADVDQLKQLAATAKGMTGYIIEVTGYADSTGSAAVNTKLSGDRAKAVITVLQQQGGVPIRHIVAPGAMGEYGAAAPNETKAGRAENRRVEVKVLVNKGIAGS
ncbi:OmpA family protein [Edaphobacter bradus]|uniref:OmpA family protein n=1 Tax=Edaphobacter bradus TaxID=2259016 RepID=UPI0021DFA039|nr:OmpA family protein [Edaphobacter bradus]